MPRVFLSGLGNLGWCHIPGAWAALSLKVGLEWGRAEEAGEGVPAKESRLDLEWLVSEWNPNLQIQWGPPMAQAA